MSDDKSKVGKPDHNLISFKQKYEFDYAVKQLQKKISLRNETGREERTYQRCQAGEPKRRAREG